MSLSRSKRQNSKLNHISVEQNLASPTLLGRDVVACPELNTFASQVTIQILLLESSIISIGTHRFP